MKSLLLLLGIVAAVLPLHGDEVFQKQPARPADLSRDKNLYTVGYAHLDTQWRWIYPETIRDFVRNTMEQNFALMEKYPNYVFNFTGSRRYEFMKEYYPEDYARVKKYVAAGQWYPAGSSVDEGDANVPSLESMTRHFLYGNRFFQHEFGKQSDEFMLPDCFGFPASLPTVLAHGGIKGFSTQKLTWGSAVGIPFNVGTWTGPDGSTILAALNPGGYGTQVTEDLSRSDAWLKRIDENGQKSGVYADFKYYGIGDRGGAARDSTVEWIERALVSGGPVRVMSAPADQIFKDITPAQAARLPNYQGELELVQHSDGALSSEAYMKRWNRKNEQLAQAAEGAAAAAAWLGVFPYPYGSLYRGWDLVLGSQMHDILPGTSVPKAYEYSWNDEVLALNQFAAVTERSCAAVLSTLDTRAQGTPVAVYNPLAIEREDPVEATLPFPGAPPPAVTAYDPQGQPVPTQILERQATSLRVLFLARVPSVGYAIYDLRPGAGPAAQSPLAASAGTLENARYRVTLNADGDIASVFDKSLHKEMLSAPARLSFHTENSFDYPAWNMNWSDRQLPVRGYVGGPAKIRIAENGPARVALEVERATENSTFIQQIRLAAGTAEDRVEVVNRIDWRTPGVSLRADFPLAAGNAQASFDDKAGVTRRGNDDEKHFELAQQQWMDLTDKDGGYGVSVLNDSKFAGDKPDDHTLRLTMLYTPAVRDRYPDQASQDIGRHEITYALAAHRGGWEDGRTPWQAARLNQPLRAFLPTAHPGASGRSFSLLSLTGDQVQVAAVKKAEDSDEIVVRVKELTGRPAAGVVLRFPVAVTSAREVDAQERAIGGAPVKDGALVFDLKKFGLRAFALKLAPPPVNAARVTSAPVPLEYDTDVISSRAQRADGAMDKDGGTYPAEMFPAQLTQEGVGFQLGPVADGAKNALAAHGQRLSLPAGDFNRVHVLAAAADGDAAAQVKIGDKQEPFNVPNWTGYVGQWDNRLWNPADAGVEHKGAPIGLVPGFIKRTPVAWFATHHSTPQGDAYYEYSYLFQLSYDLPADAKSLTLPDNPKVRVFAVSVSREPPAAPPYDTLADHRYGGAPAIPQTGQAFHDATEIILRPPLYHQPRDLRYTLDGSEPTAASRVYDGPFTIADTANLAVRQITPDGEAGPVVRGVVTVHDQTPPRLLDAVAGKAGNTLELSFSEPLTAATAADVKNYTVQPVLALAKAVPSADGRKVALTFGGPMVPGTVYTLALRGLEDTAPGGNVIQPVTRQFNARNIVYAFNSPRLPVGGIKTPVPGLPVLKGDRWTMNVLVKADTKPADRVIIAGFGQDADHPEGGPGRCFAVYPDGIRFLVSPQADVKTNSPLDLGRWQMLTATYDGDSLTVYKDAAPIMKKRMGISTDSESTVSIGATDPWDHQRAFAGGIQNFTLRRGALNGDEVKQLLAETKPAE